MDLCENGFVNVPIKRLMFWGYVLNVGTNVPVGGFAGGCQTHPYIINCLFYGL